MSNVFVCAPSLNYNVAIGSKSGNSEKRPISARESEWSMALKSKLTDPHFMVVCHFVTYSMLSIVIEIWYTTLFNSKAI